MGYDRNPKRVILNRINYTADLKELKNADLVIEATIDHFYTKQELLRTADRLCRPEVVFILTSATLPVYEVARGLTRSNLLVGARFIPPVVDVDAVELSYSPDTDKNAIEIVKRFIARLGKQAVRVHESSGLVNPRTLVTLINEAAYLLDEGTASADAIETIVKKAGEWTKVHLRWLTGWALISSSTGWNSCRSAMEIAINLHQLSTDSFVRADLVLKLSRAFSAGTRTDSEQINQDMDRRKTRYEDFSN